MNGIIKPARKIIGEIEVPGDKSITHRAFILSSLCAGGVEIENFSTARDCLSTLKCLRALGLSAEIENSTACVSGEGLFGLKKPREILDAGNSGTTARLLTGILAGQRFDSALTGDESLRKRPMQRIIQPLSLMGAKIQGSEDNLLPIKIQGGDLSGIKYSLPLPSAQVKSALLLAGLLAEGKTTLTGKLNSRDHTERMLKHLGAKFSESSEFLSVEGKAELTPGKIYVPGDISSAFFFIVAGVISHRSHISVRKIGLNPTRIGAIEVLKRMGAEIGYAIERETNLEPWGSIQAQSSRLRGIEIRPEEIPGLIDEIPILVVAATQAKGATVIRGAQELRIKESDRLKALAQELNKMGAKIKEFPDGLEIAGPSQLKGKTVNSWGDHRIAMALAVAGLVAEGETIIEDSQWIDISFPNFFELLDRVCLR